MGLWKKNQFGRSFGISVVFNTGFQLEVTVSNLLLKTANQILLKCRDDNNRTNDN